MDLERHELESVLDTRREISGWFPYKHGIMVRLSYLEKEKLVDMTNRCKKIAFKEHQRIDTIDEKKFARAICPYILEWEGLTLEVLSRLIPIQINGDHDPAAAVPCNDKFKMALIMGNYDFDSFLQASITDLDLMMEKEKEAELKNSELSRKPD